MTLHAAASLYRSYQTDDGLSHNGVWAVMQDSRGFLWFGTNDGLNRFDGLNFKVYRRVDNDSLSLGNNISSTVCWRLPAATFLWAPRKDCTAIIPTATDSATWPLTDIDSEMTATAYTAL